MYKQYLDTIKEWISPPSIFILFHYHLLCETTSSFSPPYQDTWLVSSLINVLWLSTPNIALTDLVVSFLLFFSYPINIWQPCCPYAFLFISPPCQCTPHLIHLCAVHGYVLLFFSSILPPPCGCLMLHFISIPWLCLMHAAISCY